MKKLISLLSILVMLTVLSCPVFAEEADNITVYVTIANSSLILAHQEVAVTDLDADGIVTLNDALTAAHNEHYEGGADIGYASVASDYGLSLTKLWGIENGGAYGYYINNTSPMSLTDPISESDHVVAFVYTDPSSWSDTYSYFDVSTASVTAGGEIFLTLFSSGYDENWLPVSTPVSGAVITVDGEPTEYITAEDGTVTVTVSEGKHVISAVSETQTLVPPVCIVTAEADSAPATGDGAFVCLLTLISALIFAVSCFTSRRKYAK